MTPSVPLELTEPPRILIVEDDPAIAQLIATLLESNWFYSVAPQQRRGCRHLSAGIDRPDHHGPSLHAGGDGIALIQAVRRISQTPVIIVTGLRSEYADHVRFSGQRGGDSQAV